VLVGDAENNSEFSLKQWHNPKLSGRYTVGMLKYGLGGAQSKSPGVQPRLTLMRELS
jgi:hypothetical protein